MIRRHDRVRAALSHGLVIASTLSAFSSISTPLRAQAPAGQSILGSMFKAIEIDMITLSDSGEEVRTRLALNDLKGSRDRQEASPYGKTSEIVARKSPVRIELKGYEPKAFFRYGDLTLMQFGHALVGGGRYVPVGPYRNLFSGAGKIPSGVKLEKDKTGLWVLSLSEPLKPGSYGVFFRDFVSVVWDFEVEK